MMWLHLVFFVQLIGVPWPIIKAHRSSFSSMNYYPGNEHLPLNANSEDWPDIYKIPSKGDGLDNFNKEDNSDMEGLNSHLSQKNKLSSILKAMKPPTGSSRNKERRPYPSQSHEIFPSRSDEMFPPRSDEMFPSRSDETFPSRYNEMFPTRSDEMFPPRYNEMFPPRYNEMFPSRSNEMFPSRSNEMFPSRSNEMIPTRSEEMFPSRYNEMFPSRPNEMFLFRSNEISPARSKNTTSPQSAPYSALGVSLIYAQNKGPICSAVHLKPWLLLTIADCVYKKHPDDLYVKVIKRDGKNTLPVTLPVKVTFFEIHPGYRFSNYRSHNLAIVVLNTGLDWDVEEFRIPRFPQSAEDDKVKETEAFVDEWFELVTPHNKSYILSTERKFISTDHSLCNGHKNDYNFLCVTTGYKLDTYDQHEISIPLFRKVGQSKILIGLYSGEDLNKGVVGHMFLKIFENLPWISQKLLNYPLPPLDR